jgi:hypothetical protein
VESYLNRPYLERSMTKVLKIDRALYEVDDKTRTYRFLGRNLDWKNLSEDENERNKKHIDGYTRTFRDGSKMVFKYKSKL